METVVPRTKDDSNGNSVKPFHTSTQARSSPAFVTVSHVTTSAEITNPTNINRLRNVPLLLNRTQSRSSLSSTEDESLHNIAQQPPLPLPLKDTLPRTAIKQIPLKKKSLFAQYNSSGDEYASGPNIEIDLTKTPPISSTSPLFSPRYANSPPAGSGGKYMMMSKRASWIVDAGGPSDNTASTPSTPVSLPENIKPGRSRKSSLVGTPHHHRRIISLEEIPTSSSTVISRSSATSFIMNDIKSGSISKLRQEKYHRNSSISSILTDNAGALSCSDGYESCNEVGSLNSKGNTTIHRIIYYYYSNTNNQAINLK
jgi:hypothetical protein